MYDFCCKVGYFCHSGRDVWLCKLHLFSFDLMNNLRNSLTTNPLKWLVEIVFCADQCGGGRYVGVSDSVDCSVASEWQSRTKHNNYLCSSSVHWCRTFVAENRPQLTAEIIIIVCRQCTVLRRLHVSDGCDVTQWV